MTPLYLAYDYADTIQLNSSLNDLGTEMTEKDDFCVVVVKTLYEIWGRDGSPEMITQFRFLSTPG